MSSLNSKKYPLLPEVQSFLNEVPKIELHLHLEGSITPQRWHSLIHKHQNQEFLHCSVEDLKKRYQFVSFMDFIQIYAAVVRNLKQIDDFYDITKDLLENLVLQNIRYCEVMFTPWFFTRNGLDLHEILQEIDRAAKEMEKSHQIEMKLIFDGPRNFGVDVVQEVFEMATQDKTGRVIGVGLGGDEKNYPAEWFQKPFEFAHAHGLKATAHAGETAGEESIINAIEKLKVERLGHALGIQKSSRAEELIQKKGITLDLCPTSNVCTRVLPQVENHPFLNYFKEGYSITLNSDDPTFFHTNLKKEYELIARMHQLTIPQITQILRNSVEGSFLTKEKKDNYLFEILQISDKWISTHVNRI